MKVSVRDVEYVAQLSRLELSEDEKETFVKNLNDILEHVDKLRELDTEDIEPMAHVLPIKNVFRADEVYPSMKREDILKNAPDQENGCFRVPKIVD